MLRKNFPGRKDQRKREATQRTEAYARLTVLERHDKLGSFVAKKQRKKMEAALSG